MSRVYEGLKTKARIEDFARMTKVAAAELIRDELRGTLNSALARGDARSNTDGDEGPTGEEETDDGIVTTEAELNGYYAVKAVLNGVVDVKRVFLRDAKSYCTILLDDTNRKPLVRFRFNSKQKYLGIFDQDRSEARVAIGDVDDIYQHAEAIRDSAKSYDR